MGKLYRPNIPIKKGKIENTMDKAMIIALIVLGLIIIGILTLSYKEYAKTYDKLFNGEYAEDGGSSLSANIQITDNAEILVNGKKAFSDKPLEEYTAKDMMAVGFSIFDSNVIDIGNRNGTIFKLKNIALWGSRNIICVLDNIIIYI